MGCSCTRIQSKKSEPQRRGEKTKTWVRIKRCARESGLKTRTLQNQTRLNYKPLLVGRIYNLLLPDFFVFSASPRFASEPLDSCEGRKASIHWNDNAGDEGRGW